jgi:hypothetical protein
MREFDYRMLISAYRFAKLLHDCVCLSRDNDYSLVGDEGCNKPNSFLLGI